MSPEQDDPVNRVTRSLEWFRGSRSGTTRPTESSLLSPRGLSIYTFYRGQGHSWSQTAHV